MRLLALFSLLLLAVPAAVAQAPAKPRPGALAEPRAVAPRGALAPDEQNNIAVFKVGSPSTVHITTIEAQRDLFTLNVTQVPRGTGSGFIWDERGHVVTNFHVIQGASGARVTLADQSEWPAELAGFYPDRDLAVLKIDAPRDKLKPISIGTSRDLVVGQKVYAIGNPFGLDQTLTTGVISALNREIDSVNNRKIRGVIQTDAAINPGNSGGPLLDSAARLIGVNTAIFSPSGAYAGVGFAIPVDEVNRVVPRLIRDGRFTRPSLGIQTGPPEFQQALRLPKGVPVLGVVAGSPAAAAGIRAFRRARGGDIVPGDIITAIDRKPIATFDELLDALEWHQAGQAVIVSVLRAGKTVELQVRLAPSE
jgi:S1-C subfamily serine protease